MNATMIKGERSKLLAVVLALAMVVVGAAVVMSDNGVDAETYNGVSELQTALNGEEPTVTLGNTLYVNDSETLTIPEGKTLAISAGVYLYVNGGEVSGPGTIDLDGFVSIIKGTVDGIVFECPSHSGVVVQTIATGDATISNCTFNGDSNSAVYLDMGKSIDVTISNCTFNGTYGEGAVSFDIYENMGILTIESENPEQSIDLNVYSTSGKSASIGTNLVIDTGVSEIKMADYSGNVPTIVVPEGETLQAETISGSGYVQADDIESIQCDDIEVPIIQGDEYHVSTYDQLVQVLTNDGITVVLDKNIDLTSNIAVKNNTLDLNDNKISLGEYGITLGNGAIENGTIAKTGGASSNGIAVSVSGDSAITYVKFVMTESAERYMPFALSFDSGESTVTGCTFTADGKRFGAIHNNFSAAGGSVAVGGCNFDNGIIVMKEFGKIDVVDSGQVILSIGLYGGDDNRTVSMNKNTFTYSGTTDIVETMFGWDPSTIPPEHTYQGNITLEVEGDYDLGKITLGAVDTDHQTNVLDVKSGDVTADGGCVNTLKIENGASFNSTDMMKVELLTMYDASQVPENVYPSKVNVESSTGERRPVASDFAVIQYVPTYYTGKTTDALYYIARPANVNVSVVTILDTMDDISQKDVGNYTTEMRLSITYTFGDDQDTTTVTLTFNWSILPAESQMGFGSADPDSSVVVTNPDDSTKIAVSGEVTGTDGDYTIDVAIDPKAYNDKGSIVSINSGYTLKFEDGSDVTVKDGNIITLPIDSLTDAEPVVIIYDADGDGANYAATTYTISFSNLKADAEVTFHPITDDNVKDVTGSDDLYGKAPSDLQTDLVIDENLNVTGTVNWVYGYDGYSTGAYGYFIAFYLQLPAGVESWDGVYVSVTHGEKTITWDGTNSVYDGYFVGKVMNNASVSITVDLDGNLSGGVFDTAKYTINLAGTEAEPEEKLQYQSVAGYQDNGQPRGDGKEATFEGITVDDAIGETIFIVYNSEGYSGNIGLNLYMGSDATGELVYSSDYNQSNGTVLRYFSFLQHVLDYQTEQGNENYKMVPGQYFIEIYAMDGEVKNIITTNTVFIPEVYGAGYDDDAAQVIADVTEATDGAIVLPDEGVDAVGPQTMWIAWYSSMTAEEVTAKLYKNGGEDAIFTETIDAWNAIGPHIWYFSFEEGSPADLQQNLADYAGPGVYTMVVTDDKGNEVAKATVVIDGSGPAGYEEDVQDAYDGIIADGGTVNGVTETDKTGDIVENTGWLVWYGQNYEGKVTATLTWQADENSKVVEIYVQTSDDIPNWKNAGAHTWYFSIAEGQPVMTYVTDNGISYTACANGTYVMTITVEGLEEPVATGEFIVYDKEIYYVTYIDEGWNNNAGYEYSETISSGEKFQLPALPDGTKTPVGWQIEGTDDVYAAGSYVNLSKYGNEDNKNRITFIAQYGSSGSTGDNGDKPVSEHTIQYWIGAAPEYTYGESWKYAGWYDIDGSTVYAVYTIDEYGTEVMMNDFARYIGALYHASEGDIVSVYFNGVKYTWNAELGLTGSNWANGDTTLVSVVVDYFQAAADDNYSAKNGITLELTNKAGEKVAMNYYLAIESDGTGSGDDGYDLVRQLSCYNVSVTATETGFNIRITVDEKYIDGYRNVLEWVQVTYTSLFGDGSEDGVTYFAIDEPDENGVVLDQDITIAGGAQVMYGAVIGADIVSLDGGMKSVLPITTNTDSNTTVKNE